MAEILITFENFYHFFSSYSVLFQAHFLTLNLDAIQIVAPGHSYTNFCRVWDFGGGTPL